MAEYIDKGQLLKDIKRVNTSDCTDIDDIFTEIKRTIDNQFVADVAEIKHGKWKKIQNYALCSNCKHEVNWDSNDFMSNYCPNCGAKMEEKNE